MASTELKSYQFRCQREASWRELEKMLTVIEKQGVGSLSTQDAIRLPMLYRSTVSALSVARAISLDTNVIEYLEALSVRAHGVVYREHRFGSVLLTLLVHEFPRAVRSAWRAVALAFLCYFGGALFGASMVFRDEAWVFEIVKIPVAFDFLGMGPRTDLLAFIPDASSTESRMQWRTLACYMFTSDAILALLCYATGFLLGIPTFILLFANGLTLGASCAYHLAHDRFPEFCEAFMSGGTTAVIAFCLAGAAGFIVAQGFGFPGERTRIAALSRAGQNAARLLPGIAFMFAVSACLHALAIADRTSEYGSLAVGVFVASAWGVYLVLAGDGMRREGRVD